MQSYINYKKFYDKKAKASPLEEKKLLIFQPKADQQGSKLPFRDFRWTGLYLVENVLTTKNYILRKLNTNKFQILHRIRFRKYNLETQPHDNYQETQWQTDENTIILQDDLYTLAWEAEVEGHQFDIPFIYTHPKASDFDESHTQGPDTGFVPRSNFHDSSYGQNRENCSISDPSVVHISNTKSHGESQKFETNSNLRHNDGSEQTSESNTGNETAYEPIQYPPPRQSDPPSTIEINDPTTEIIPPNEPNQSKNGK